MLIRNGIILMLQLALCMAQMVCTTPEAIGAEKPPTIMQTIKLYQGVLKFPTAPWVKGLNDIKNIKNSQNQDKSMFSLEQIPKAQEFDSWKNLYGIYGFYLPGYDMKRFVEESLNALALGCKGKTKSKVVSTENGKIILTFFCSDLQDPLVFDNNNTESGFLYISQVKQSFAKVYMAWRAPSEYMKTDKWPMNKENITKAIEALKTIRYFPAEQ